MKIKSFLFIALVLVTIGLAFSNRTKPLLESNKTTRFYSSQNLLPISLGQDNTRTSKRKIRLALIIDTSNSMDGLIDQAKAQLWNIVGELAKAKYDSAMADVSIGLYEYGNDNISRTSDYVRQILPFTKDLDLLSEKLFALRTNGGNEYCGSAIKRAVSELDWSTDSLDLNIVYIAGNEGFYQGNYSYREACGEARSKNIYVNTIFCGNHSTGISEKWQDGAQRSGGLFFSIDSDQQTVFVETPFDDEINQLNLSLNQTYIYYGKNGKHSRENQIAQDENSQKYSKSNAAKRTISKSSQMYSNSTWDLIDAYNGNAKILNEVDKKTLPLELKDKSIEEIEAKIAELGEKRTQIQKEIKALALKREAFLKSQSSLTVDNKSTLGEKIIEAVHRQASKTGFTFD